MTAAKLGNPAGEPVPLAALGGDLAEVSKKCHGLVICGCIAHEDQVLYLAPSGLSALGQRGQMLRPRLSLMLLAAATLGIRPLFGDAFSLLFYAAGCGPQFTGGATCAGIGPAFAAIGVGNRAHGEGGRRSRRTSAR